MCKSNHDEFDYSYRSILRWDFNTRDYDVHNDQVLNGRADVIFIGSREIEEFDVNAFWCGDYKVINRGKSEDFIDDVIDRLYRDCIDLNPKVCVVCFGNNEMSSLNYVYRAGRKVLDATIDDISKKAYKSFERLFEIFDKSKVELVMCSILPMLNNPEIYNYTGALAKKLNESLRYFCSKYQVSYVDLYTSLCDSYYALDEKFGIKNTISLNGKGYKIVADLISDTLNEKLGYSNKDTREPVEIAQIISPGRIGEESYCDFFRKSFNIRNSQALELKNRPDLVMIGDSITEHFPAELFLEGKGTILNRGAGGDKIEGVLHRFRADVIDLDPKKCILLVGINDIFAFYSRTVNQKLSEENIKNNFNDFLQSFKQKYEEIVNAFKQSNIKLFVCTLLPVKTTATTIYDYIKKVNLLIEEIAKNNDLEFIDYYTAFVDENGELNEKHSPDGVHPNYEGYKILSNIIKNSVVSY